MSDCDGVFWTADAVSDNDPLGRSALPESEATDGDTRIEVDVELLGDELTIAESLMVEASDRLTVSVR